MIKIIGDDRKDTKCRALIANGRRRCTNDRRFGDYCILHIYYSEKKKVKKIENVRKKSNK